MSPFVAKVHSIIVLQRKSSAICIVRYMYRVDLVSHNAVVSYYVRSAVEAT